MDALRKFLSDSTQYYTRLLHSLDTMLPPSVAQADPASVRLSKQRCLVALGDLARYTERLADTSAASKDWGHAAAYYLEAASVCPEAGVPQNQLGVVAVLQAKPLLAAYRYTRAEATEKSFEDRTHGNLMLLFRHNKADDDVLPSQPSAAAAAATAHSLRPLCVRFVSVVVRGVDLSPFRPALTPHSIALRAFVGGCFYRVCVRLLFSAGGVISLHVYSQARHPPGLG